MGGNTLGDDGTGTIDVWQWKEMQAFWLNHGVHADCD